MLYSIVHLYTYNLIIRDSSNFLPYSVEWYVKTELERTYKVSAVVSFKEFSTSSVGRVAQSV